MSEVHWRPGGGVKVSEQGQHPGHSSSAGSHPKIAAQHVFYFTLGGHMNIEA